MSKRYSPHIFAKHQPQKNIQCHHDSGTRNNFSEFEVVAITQAASPNTLHHLAKDGDSLRIAAERANVPLHPLQAQALILSSSFKQVQHGVSFGLREQQKRIGAFDKQIKSPTSAAICDKLKAAYSDVEFAFLFDAVQPFVRHAAEQAQAIGCSNQQQSEWRNSDCEQAIFCSAQQT